MNEIRAHIKCLIQIQVSEFKFDNLALDNVVIIPHDETYKVITSTIKFL